jgi:hypothetical protein
MELIIISINQLIHNNMVELQMNQEDGLNNAFGDLEK